MSSVLGGLAGIAERSAGEALAFGLGFALGRALEPAGVGLAQTAWNIDPNKVLSHGEAAQIVAERVDQQSWGEGEARQTGIDAERFDLLVQEVLNAPGFGDLVRMVRRGTITPDDLLHGFRKNKLEDRWDAPLADLEHERLSPQELAVMAQRSVVPNDGLLPVTFDHAGATVTPMPVAQIDTLKEAAAGGYDFERLAALARIVGLPPAPGELLQLLNRGEINTADFRMGISEGNTRNEWADKLMTLKRRLLTPHEYAELQLRGLRTPAQRDAGAALSGMEATDSELLYELLGRPLPVRAITTGLARGGTYGGVYEGVPEPYLDAIRRSAIRPEYGNLAYHNRYTYPSAFVLRSLTQTKAISEVEAHQTLLDIGWEPGFAEKVATAWAGGTATKGDPHVTKAETHLWTALHKSYIDSEEDDATTTSDLTALGVASASIPEVLRLWGLERAIVRRALTPAQVKKAIGQPGKDQAWALARLAELGYSPDDAATFLAE